MEQILDRYRSDLERAMRQLDPGQLRVVGEAILAARAAGRQVFLMGNGGSAATPSHSAGDWAKELGVRARCLSDNTTVLTALANDVGYESVFAEQLRIHLSPGDVVIAYSGSGNSPNVLRAVEYARERGSFTIGVTGDYRGNAGGRLARLVDLAVVVASQSMEVIEDCHLIVNHIVKTFVMARSSASG